MRRGWAIDGSVAADAGSLPRRSGENPRSGRLGPLEQDGVNAVSVVVITGCSSGIGFDAALAFAERADRVVATMRDVSRSPRLLAAAEAAALSVDIREMDVTDDASVRGGLARIEAEYGRIDTLVNNAGIGGRAAVETYPDQLVREIFETNVFGVLRTLRAVLPGMRDRRSGAIVNVSSVSGRLAGPFNAAYAASKHALEAFSEALALEVEPFDIRVAIVEPGYVATDMGEKVVGRSRLDPDSPYAYQERHAVNSVVPSIRAGRPPREVADVIVEAATTASPRLRWESGADAEAILEARRTLGEEAWADYLRARVLAPAP